MRPVLLCSLLHLLALACAPHRPVATFAPLPQATLGDTAFYGPGITSASRTAVDFTLARPASVIVLQLGPDGWLDLVNPMSDDDRSAYAPGFHRIRLPAASFATAISSPAVDPPWGASCALSSLTTAPTDQVRTPHDSLGRPTTPMTSYSRQVYQNCLDRSNYWGLGRRDAAVVSIPWSGRWPAVDSSVAVQWVVVLSDAPVTRRWLQARLSQMSRAPTAPGIDALPAALLGGRAARWAAYVVGVP